MVPSFDPTMVKDDHQRLKGFHAPAFEDNASDLVLRMIGPNALHYLADCLATPRVQDILDK